MDFPLLRTDTCASPVARHSPRRIRADALALGALFLLFVQSLSLAVAQQPEKVHLRAWGVPGDVSTGPAPERDARIISAFQSHFPWVELSSPSNLWLPGDNWSMDVVPFMQIAGDLAPDVMYVNFRQSDVYIAKRLLYPLDHYLEASAGIGAGDHSALDTPAYLSVLRNGAGWEEIDERVPAQCWPVMRRLCPYGESCPFRSEWKLPPLVRHLHVWTYPIGPLITGMKYDRTLFVEYAADGIEQRAPKDWDEFIKWAKILTKPELNEYGLFVRQEGLGWLYLQLLYAAGGEAVQQDSAGGWRCSLNSEAAVQAMYMLARIKLEPIKRPGRTYRGVYQTAQETGLGQYRFGMEFVSLDDRFLAQAQEQIYGFGPVPAGPTQLRRGEFNSRMLGMFCGLAKDPHRREAAWEYIHFFDGPEARRIRTEALVRAGLGRFVRPKLLERFNDGGRYDLLLKQISSEIEETYRVALAGGVPEPYGTNCQYIFQELNRPIGQVLGSSRVLEAVDRQQPDLCMDEIRRILADATKRIDLKLLGNLSPQTQRHRATTAWVVIAAIVVAFAVLMRRAFRSFRFVELDSGASMIRRQSQYRWAYLALAPAILSIVVWMYWPMVRGTTIAFQDYGVVGQSRWIGSDNFASVLFDDDFWHSMRVTLAYTVMFIIAGFGAPIFLALLLHEVPKGGTAFRVAYYVPAVLSGTVVIFLWKSFYGSDGLVDAVINAFISAFNFLTGGGIAQVHANWLESPAAALVCCLIPTVWAGMGAGSLIYLAALRTIPDELYEAADIDGANALAKVFRIAIPSIKPLIVINFIGAVIGAVRGAGGFVLAMTSGGPFDQSGGATEVVGLKLYYTTFGHLDFGGGAAMAWILGSILLGFTVLQVQRLSRMQFRAAEAGT